MTHDTEFWGLEYCSTCIQMTNHDDNGCLKCRAKVAMTGVGQELKRIMDSYHLGGYGEEYEEIAALITAHTNAEVAKVLDRLEAQWGETIDNTLGKPIKIKFVSLAAIQAERARLKEVK
jgi:hypothetical protein